PWPCASSPCWRLAPTSSRKWLPDYPAHEYLLEQLVRASQRSESTARLSGQRYPEKQNKLCFSASYRLQRQEFVRLHEVVFFQEIAHRHGPLRSWRLRATDRPVYSRLPRRELPRVAVQSIWVRYMKSTSCLLRPPRRVPSTADRFRLS